MHTNARAAHLRNVCAPKQTRWSLVLALGLFPAVPSQATIITVEAEERFALRWDGKDFKNAGYTRTILETVTGNTGDFRNTTFTFDTPVVPGSVSVVGDRDVRVSNVVITPSQVSYRITSVDGDPGTVRLQWDRVTPNGISTGIIDGRYTLRTGSGLRIGSGGPFPLEMRFTLPGSWFNEGTSGNSHQILNLNPSWNIDRNFLYNGANTTFIASLDNYTNSAADQANFGFRLYGSKATPTLPSTPVVKPTSGSATFLGSVLGTDGKLRDPSLPLVVITHGWQPTDLWTGGAPLDWVNEMGLAVRAATDPKANVVLWIWKDAFFTTLGSATASVANQGQQLGRQLLDWGVTSSTPIHFIGHSLGTLVNAYASDTFTDKNIPVGQFTILDRPFGKAFFGDVASRNIDPGPNADEILFQTLLKEGSVKFVDNYYGNDSSLPTPAVGTSFKRATASYERLYNGADHTRVHDIYDATIGGTTGCSPSGGFGCSIAMEGNEGLWSEWDPGTIVAKTEKFELKPVDWLNIRCSLDSGVTTCTEGSPAYFWNDTFTIPSWAEYLSFDFKWLNPGDGDWLSVLFDDFLLFNYLGTDTGDDFINSGLLPVAMFAGQTGQLLFALNSVGDPNAEFAFTNLQFTGFVDEPSTIALLLFAVAMLIATRRRPLTVRGLA